MHGGAGRRAAKGPDLYDGRLFAGTVPKPTSPFGSRLCISFWCTGERINFMPLTSLLELPPNEAAEPLGALTDGASYSQAWEDSSFSSC